MKILLDTNILIQRENNSIVPINIAKLIKLIEELNYAKCIHALSIIEIKKDGNSQRREINLSKLSSYPILDDYPDCSEDSDFINKLPEPKNENDRIDNQLLYCVNQNMVSHLITEDQGLLKKAENIGLQTVYSVNEALEIFSASLTKYNINLASTFEEIKPFKINIEDPIFKTLKESYPEFVDSWWKKVVESNRTVYLFKDSATDEINAILIPKIEEEEIDCEPSIPIEKYVKICLFKVSEKARGLKLGEHLLNMAINFAKINKINKLYLTHYREENDYLIYLIEEYGFQLKGKNKRGEEIFIKEIVAPDNILSTYSSPTIINKIYYPSFCDAENINKFIIPIMPKYHKMLFPEYKHKEPNLLKQLFLFKLQENIKSHGYGIKKAYLCHSSVSTMKPGDVILFYRTEDYKAITTIGIVDYVSKGNTNIEIIKNLSAKRTVFSENDLKKISEKETTVILFKMCMHFNNEISYNELLKKGIVTGPIQRMQTVSNENYKKIIEGNIDERFTIH